MNITMFSKENRQLLCVGCVKSDDTRPLDEMNAIVYKKDTVNYMDALKSQLAEVIKMRTW